MFLKIKNHLPFLSICLFQRPHPLIFRREYVGGEAVKVLDEDLLQYGRVGDGKNWS